MGPLNDQLLMVSKKQGSAAAVDYKLTDLLGLLSGRQLGLRSVNICGLGWRAPDSLRGMTTISVARRANIPQSGR